MKTIEELHYEIGGEITNMFEYNANKDYSYRAIVLNYLDMGTLKRIVSNGYMAIAEIFNEEQEDGTFVQFIKYIVRPKSNNELEFVG